MENRSEIMNTAYLAMYDKRAKMSERVACAFLYAVLRLGDVIDWWFPVNV